MMKKYEELVLTMLELSSAFSGPAAKNMEFERRDLGQIIKYTLKTLVPAEDVKTATETMTARYPDGWVEALKEHMPGWILKRYPVRYMEVKRTVTFTAYHVYPQLPNFLQNCGDSRQMIVVREEAIDMDDVGDYVAVGDYDEE